MYSNTSPNSLSSRDANITSYHHVNIQLSLREVEELRLISHEYTSKEIAELLFISPHTVDSHKKNLKLKLDVKNTAALVRSGFELVILQITNAA